MKAPASLIRRAVLPCGLLLLGNCHHEHTPLPKPTLDVPSRSTLSSDPELAAAERAAIAGLGDFRMRLQHASPALRSFEVKAVVRYGSQVEMLWLGDVRLAPGGFDGSVILDPRILTAVKRGQRETVANDAVVDWAYQERGQARGGETRRIMERQKRAAELAEALAHCGEPRFADGCTALGERYANGSFGEAQLDTAFQLYARACAGGSAYGCNAAGWASLHGRGTLKDLASAAEFFAEGCKTGDEHPFACDSRGFALLSGLAGTPRDIGRGQRLLDKACARGVPQSCLLLELLRAKRLRTGLKLELACEVNVAEQISRCTTDEDPEACFLAGSVYQTGVCGAPRNEPRSLELLQRAGAFGATWPQSV
jgi:TPR repeat protein